MRENDLLDEIQPAPFEVLRAFLSEGIEDAESVSVEVSAIAA